MNIGSMATNVQLLRLHKWNAQKVITVAAVVAAFLLADRAAADMAAASVDRVGMVVAVADTMDMVAVVAVTVASVNTEADRLVDRVDMAVASVNTAAAPVGVVADKLADTEDTAQAEAGIALNIAARLPVHMSVRRKEQTCAVRTRYQQSLQ